MKREQDMQHGQGPIPTECKLPSKYVSVHGSKMHYLEVGEGRPILFVHGMPTYSYLWRNIIPHFDNQERCIAVDLIGMGLSDKPNIDYTIFDHIKYLTGFIEALELTDVTLVLHGWGSVAGFEYAHQHEKNVKGLAFYESHIRANVDWDMLSLPVQQLATLLNRPGASYRAIVNHNYLLKKLLPQGVLRRLSAEELSYYEKPFLTTESRKPLWQYILELPLGKNQGEVVELIQSYSQWLQQTTIPKLMMYAIPGFTTTIATVDWAKHSFPNLTLIELPDALHFAQESIPDIFAEELLDWTKKIK